MADSEPASANAPLLQSRVKDQCGSAVVHVKEQCGPITSRVQWLMERSGAQARLERWLEWSPRLRRLKECSDDYPYLRACCITVYCTKTLIIAGLIMLAHALQQRSPYVTGGGGHFGNETAVVTIRPAIGMGTGIESLDVAKPRPVLGRAKKHPSERDAAPTERHKKKWPFSVVG